jgi:uncharacterized protein (DUF1778 family)
LVGVVGANQEIRADAPELLYERLSLTAARRTDMIRTTLQEIIMPGTGAARQDRIELRATKEEKRLLAAAAAHERLDVTSFIMRSALPAAREVVDRAERIVLGARDTARILRLLESPPKPTRALMAAARRRAHRK